MLILACLYNFNYVMLRVFRENLVSKECPVVMLPWGSGGLGYAAHKKAKKNYNVASFPF